MECTCECPDGPGQHMCGCQTYDTPRMAELRFEYRRAADRFSRALSELGNCRASLIGQNTSKAIKASEALLKITAAIAVEDMANPNGRHNDTPWKE